MTFAQLTYRESLRDIAAEWHAAMKQSRWCARALAMSAVVSPVLVLPAFAHGFAGQRFFPATILTDDPFVADEMSLPTVTGNPPAAGGLRETDIGFDLSKRITPDLGMTIGEQWERVLPEGGAVAKGWGALQTGVQYQFFVDEPRESIGLVGLNATWANTGRVQALGAPDFTTLSPVFDFGKGFGDLPDSVWYLRPFAVTGNLGFSLPTRAESAGMPNPDSINYGFALEYSLSYLECCVRDVGLRRPFSQIIPLVEVAYTAPINRVPSSQAIGTIQPGIIWSGQTFQVGMEAVVPATRATGHGLGWVAQLHFYLDDLFPGGIGRPISEWWQQ